MSKTLQKAIWSALVALSIIRASESVRAQNRPGDVPPIGANAAGCKVGHRTVPFADARIGNDGRILPGQVLVRARALLDQDTTATVVEHPRYGEDSDSYNSTIIMKRGQKRTKYPIGQLIKDGSGLRMVEIASLCSSPDEGTFVLAFEAGSTGGAEGFAIVPVLSRCTRCPNFSYG